MWFRDGEVRARPWHQWMAHAYHQSLHQHAMGDGPGVRRSDHAVLRPAGGHRAPERTLLFWLPAGASQAWGQRWWNRQKTVGRQREVMWHDVTTQTIHYAVKYVLFVLFLNALQLFRNIVIITIIMRQQTMTFYWELGMWRTCSGRVVKVGIS